MANSKHFAKLKKSIDEWHAWRTANPDIAPNLIEADLRGANLNGASLNGADLSETVISDTNLNDTQGLDACVHYGPSTIDHRTSTRSGPLPLVFLRGCGLPD